MTLMMLLPRQELRQMGSQLRVLVLVPSPYALQDWLLVDDESLEGAIILGEEGHCGDDGTGEYEGTADGATVVLVCLTSLIVIHIHTLTPPYPLRHTCVALQIVLIYF